MSKDKVKKYSGKYAASPEVIEELREFRLEGPVAIISLGRSPMSEAERAYHKAQRAKRKKEEQ